LESLQLSDREIVMVVIVASVCTQLKILIWY